MARSDSGPTGVTALAGSNLLLRFLLELAMLAALATWGIRVADPVWLRVLLAIVAPALAVLVWGAFVAPRAPRRLADPGRLAVEIAQFGLAAAGLWAVGLTGWAIALAAVAAVNIAVLTALHQR